MNIIESTRRCIENNQVMYRECFDQILYEPTNTDECIIVHFENKKVVRWNPAADDIVADDWQVKNVKKSNVTQRVLELKPDFAELKTELNVIEKQIDLIITKLEKASKLSSQLSGKLGL